MILDELAAHARERVAADKAKIPLEDMKAQAKHSRRAISGSKKHFPA